MRHSRTVLSLASALVVLAPGRACAGQEPPALNANKAAPAQDAKGVVMREFRQRNARYEREQLLAAYQSIGQHDPAWDADAIAAIEEISRDFADAAPPLDDERLASLVRKAIAAGCKDPLIQSFQALILSQGADRDASGKALAESVAALKASKYPPLRLAMMASRLAEFYGEKEKDKADAAYDESAAAFARVFNDPAPKQEDLRYLYSKIAPRLRNEWPVEAAGKLMWAIENAEGVDPWITEMVGGLWTKRLGWQSRGTGSIDTVAPGGHSALKQKMAEARPQFEKAHAMAPDRPEAATELIEVAMVGATPEGQDAEYWFRKATAAQFDYTGAYQRMLFSLRPRWGGSFESMAAFAERCLKTKRYDTRVPYFFVEAILGICEDSRDYESPWRNEEVYASSKEVLTELSKTHPETADRDLSLLAAIAWQAGEYADVCAALERVGKNFDNKAAWLVRATRDDIEPDAYAHTCSAGQLVGEADEALSKQEWESAVSLLTRAAAAAANDREEARAGVARRLAMASFYKSYAGEEWVPLTFTGDMGASWKAITGDWHRVDGATVRGTSKRGLLMLFRSPVGRRWEVTAQVNLERAGERATGGLVWGYDTAAGEAAVWMSMFLLPGENAASLRMGMHGMEQRRPVKLRPAANEFSFESWDDWVRLRVNGEPVYEGQRPYPRGPWIPGDQIGLGAWFEGSGEAVVYSDLKIRLLTKPPTQEATGIPRTPKKK